jgi:hypothetical protein
MGDTDRPGREIPKEYRDVVDHLIDTQRWRYERSGRHPRLYPLDRTFRPIPVPTTPGDRRSFENWKHQITRAGGRLP